MATKTYFINLFLICCCFHVFAQNEQLQLQQWTKTNETKLLNKYPIQPSTWFEAECMKLAKSMNFRQINQCHLFQSDHVNAYVFNNGHVYFSTAMMKFIKNKHQWASILAHENAHIELNHYIKTLKQIQKPGIFFPKRRLKKLLKDHERQADFWAANKLKEYKFNPEQITYFLKRVEEVKSKKKSKYHLKVSKRVIETQKPEIMNDQVIGHVNKL